MSRKWIGIVALVAVLLGTLGLPARAAQPNTYQVTGPVLELTSDMIVVKKGSERWEIARGSAKVTGDLKVGATVTIQYRMTATAIDVKADKGAAKKEAKPKKGKG
jgi:RNase P/RNase MRP subunit p29